MGPCHLTIQQPKNNRVTAVFGKHAGISSRVVLPRPVTFMLQPMPKLGKAHCDWPHNHPLLYTLATFYHSTIVTIQ